MSSAIRTVVWLVACSTVSPVFTAAAQTLPGARPESLVEAIVYTTLRPPNLDIYLIDEAGGEPRRLTDDPALDYNAVFSPDGRWVVFTSERAGSADLYALDLEGGGPPVRLTRHHAMNDAAAFSPDGGRLAFVSTRDGYADIFVMPFAPGDTTAEDRAVNLTRRPGGDFNPAFSPDGRHIAFARQEHLWSPEEPQTTEIGSFATGHFAVELYVMDVDGSNARRLSEPGAGPVFQGVSFPATAGSPAWSPDGEAIYYYRFGPEGTEIRRIAPDGSGDVRVAADGLSPAVRPDGRQVRLPDRTLEVRAIRGYFPAFTPAGDVLWTPSLRPLAGDEGPLPLNISAIDGSGTRVFFTPASGVAWGAAVAGAADRVVVAVGPPFASYSDARVDIWSLRLDGSEPVNLTPESPDNDALPAISADGRRIVFRRGRYGGTHVYVMDGDGANPRRLTDAVARETMPALSPDGEWVVFPTDRAGGRKLWIQRVDGSEGRFLEPDRLEIPDLSLHPRFSPDGGWVVFTSDRSGFNDEWPLTWVPQPYGELWAVPASGGPAVRLTQDKWENGPSDWGYARLPDRRR